MKNNDAVKIVIDVALKRYSHSRQSLKAAVDTLEQAMAPKAKPAPKPATGGGI
jgi:hypothetical protein